ncbi:MAG: LPS assembly lipoprotein LptE, partial [Steroidobacteraceae bacterium]
MRRLLMGAGLLSAALAAGCGFQLRGQTPLPAALLRPYLETEDRYTPLYSALAARLEAAGAALAPAASGASAVI